MHNFRARSGPGYRTDPSSGDELERVTRPCYFLGEPPQHVKLLCACANVAVTWHCNGYEVSSFSGFPPGNEAIRSLVESTKTGFVDREDR